MPAGTSAVEDPPQTVVIRAKLRPPPLAERLVGRPRVEETLAALIERHRVVVISATAGAGKTTAVTAAVRMLTRPAAWLTLDWTDAAPGRLVRYLEAALAGRLPQVGRVAADALAARIPRGCWSRPATRRSRWSSTSSSGSATATTRGRSSGRSCATHLPPCGSS
jgi:hypothetical protein